MAAKGLNFQEIYSHVFTITTYLAIAVYADKRRVLHVHRIENDIAQPAGLHYNHCVNPSVRMSTVSENAYTL